MSNNKKTIAGRRLPAITFGAVAGLAGVVGLAVQAQEEPLINMGLTFGARFEDRKPEDDRSVYFARLATVLTTGTRTQSLRIASDSQLTWDSTTEEGIEFERPTLNIRYSTGNRSTQFEATLSRRTEDVDALEEIIDPITGDLIDLVDDSGTLETLRFSTGLTTGIDAPFGTETQFSFTRRAYTGTNDPSLTDLDNYQIGTTLRFDVDPRIRLTASANFQETEEDNETSTTNRTTQYGLGGTFLIDRLWTGTAALRYSVFETEQTVGPFRLTTENEGVGYSLGLSRAMRNGSIAFVLSREESDNGEVDNFSVTRDRDLRNGGTLAWSVGLSEFPDGDVVPLASVSFSRPTIDGNFSVDLTQTARLTDDGNVVLTSLGVNYGQEINSISNWSLNGSLTSLDNSLGTEEDQSRASVGVTYNRALTEDWNLSTSLSHNITYAGGDFDSRASVLSLSLQRDFSFRP